MSYPDQALAEEIGERVERFVRETVASYERDPRLEDHGPSEDLVRELRAMAREAGVMTPHILPDHTHLTQRGTAHVLKKSGLSPLGPVACNTGAPDEGNMFLLGKVATDAQRARFLDKLLTGEARSAFFMTEPSADNGAGSDPSMMKTVCVQDGDAWVINGHKTYITGAEGASVGIVMAKAEEGACMFLVDLPHPAIKIVRLLDTIDSSMPGGHAEIRIENLRVPASDMLGNPGEGFRYAQIRLAPARLSHCMRWHGVATRAHEIATTYACRRRAFGKLLVDHEGVGFMLAENQIDLKQAELMIDWCADALDAGENGNVESSMAKVAVSEALFRVADRCVQVMGAMGVTRDTIVEQLFREVRAFRIYDGPTEVHKWSLAKKIKKAELSRSA
ncbi:MULTISPECIES: acyl-CoA dehydrogenase family protein [unclassified Hyphomonas]|uniref:acyl-CoA dehydrogenase family protein n=1 Tax=unclassified Hyphomonas TaxID=2630699 RepID=UPI000458D424|nr:MULTISPECIES: acyl-CoA dehydrogenase family protein [unclassified Hyphomonas]KCZ48521.1 acyl-CoA dehydrogenase [Hyphomonas sp. CY54-11-8]